MKLLQTIKSNIPNTITCLNLLSGCFAIISAFHYGESFETIFGNLKGYEVSFLFIGLAAIFDFCDGFAARMLHAYSSLGKELDSLSDLVSFGVAPSMLVYNMMLAHNEAGSVFPYFALIIAVFAGIRLAKFNIDDRQTTTFIGLPVPANAIFWIGACAWVARYSFYSNVAIVLVVCAMSYMMISPMRMFSLKFRNLDFQENLLRYILILGTVLFVVSYGVTGLAWTIVLYIFLSYATRNRLI